MLSFCIALNFQFSQSQVIEFSADSTEFLADLKSAYDADDRKLTKAIHEELELVWHSPDFQPYIPYVMSAAYSMASKKLRADYYKDFVHNLLAFYKAGRTPEEIKTWAECISYLIKEKSNLTIQNYLEFSLGLFENNYLYKSQSHAWRLSTPQYLLLMTPGKGPEVEVYETNLHGTTSTDSCSIYGTQGHYNFLTELFEGNGGQVFWTRHGISPDVVSVVMGKYQVGLNRITFKADSVTFVHSIYMQTPLLGRFEEKLISTANLSQSSYPKFESYGRIEIPDIDGYIDFVGNFSYYGNKVCAVGDSLQKASLTFSRDGKVFMQAVASSFQLDDDRFTSIRALLVIYFDEDSIYHPGVELRYNREKKEVSLIRLGETAFSPFFDSYHQLELFSEGIYWQTDDEEIRVSMIKGAAGSTASFRSYRFFNELEYERLQGLDNTFPFVKLNDMLRAKGDTMSFTLPEFARHIRSDLSEVEQLLLAWSNAGIIQYSPVTRKAKINEKFRFYNRSRSGLADYDQIEFYSYTKGDNAKLNLDQKNMDLQGVYKVMLSDSQKVSVFPDSGALSLEKDRNFIFGGRIDAGRMELFGTDFKFTYADFDLELPLTDSIRTTVPNFEQIEGMPIDEVTVSTVIEGVKGDLKIDEPGNKAGLKPFSQYPVLQSKENSYAYYDNTFIEGGVYERSRFFYKLEPFEFDSLDNFPVESFSLPGQLYSADIFPVIQKNLVVMKDYSLGFGLRIDEGGLPAYGGKGFFHDSVSLSNKGLRGWGRLEFLNSTTWSRNFRFYPDSMNVLTDSVRIMNSGNLARVPETFATRTKLHWEPAKDQFFIHTIDKPIKLYEGQALFTGRLRLDANGLEGKGKIQIGKAILSSDRFEFKEDGFLADTADFALVDYNLANKDSSGVVIQTKNFRAEVSFTDRQGVFTSNEEGDSEVDFPVNKFKAKIEEVVWNMGDSSTTLGSDETSISMKNAHFFASEKSLNNLNFDAQTANFYLKDKVIACEGVEYIDVADSRIFPSDKNVMIRETARLDTFAHATVWVGKEEKTHVLDDALVNIETGTRYTGTGEFTYVDALKETQKIFFSEITVPNNKTTQAKGIIDPIQGFTLSPDYTYKGNVLLSGDKKLLTFDGYAGLKHNCPLVFNNWLKFTSPINPDSIYLPVTADPLNELGEKLFNGFLFGSDSIIEYPDWYEGGPAELPRSDYYLYYDSLMKQYVMVPYTAVFDAKDPDEIWAFGAGHCDQPEASRLYIYEKYGQSMVKAAGKITSPSGDPNIKAEMTLTVDFKMDRDVLRYVAGKFPRGDGSFKGAEVKKSISMLSPVPEETEGTVLGDGTYEYLPDVLRATLVLTGVNFTWSSTESKLVHVGKVYFMVINGNQMMKQCDAYIELNRGGKEDTYTIYLELDKNTWFIFHYEGNEMLVSSSFKEYNEMITAIDPFKKQFNVKGQPNYQYGLADQKKTEEIRKKYRGGQE